MRVGFVFPHAEVGNDPVAVRDLVQAAEALGYRHLQVFDHVLGADPNRPGGWDHGYTSATPFHEPFVLAGYIAALTSTIEIMTGVLVLPQRQTALVAKQAAEVDLLSSGRLVLGIGSGWNAVEYDALGTDFGTRAARMEEQVEVLRLLWANDVVDYRGRFHTIDRAGINPRPARDIPIWFGATADRALRRTAHLGSGWFPLLAPGDEFAAALHRLRGYITEAGRDPDTFAVCGFVNYENGNLDKWRRQLEGWRAAGATHVSLRTTPPVLGSARDGIDVRYHIRALEEYREAFADTPD